MNASETSKLLRKLGACSEAREWAVGKDMPTIWATCERGDWLEWLLNAIEYTWPAEIRAEYLRIADQAQAEFNRIKDQAQAEFNRITAPARAEYIHIADQAQEEYDRIADQAQEEFNRITALAWEEYDRITAQALRNMIPYPAEYLKGA